jgi:GT2 family glycosyltransferase
VIPTRNRAHGLVETLTSISCGNCLPQEIIIVDQSDVPIDKGALRDAVDEMISLDVLYLAKPSLTRARNVGAAATTGAVLLFMDDDVLLNAESMRELAIAFEDDRVAFVGTLHMGEAAQERRYPDILGLLFARKELRKKGGYVCRGAMLGRYPDRICDVVDTEWGMGYFFAVRKQLFDRLGICFDENLISYAYPEDLDFTYTFCSRAVAQGYRAVLSPRIYVNHTGSAEWRLPKRKQTYMYVIHRLYLSYKHFRSPLYRFALVWSDVGEILRRMLVREDYVSIVKAYAVSFGYRQDFKRGLFPAALHKYLN